MSIWITNPFDTAILLVDFFAPFFYVTQRLFFSVISQGGKKEKRREEKSEVLFSHLKRILPFFFFFSTKTGPAASWQKLAIFCNGILYREFPSSFCSFPLAFVKNASGQQNLALTFKVATPFEYIFQTRGQNVIFHRLRLTLRGRSFISSSHLSSPPRILSRAGGWAKKKLFFFLYRSLPFKSKRRPPPPYSFSPPCKKARSLLMSPLRRRPL